MSDSAQNGKLMVGGIATLLIGVLLLLGNFIGIFRLGAEASVIGVIIYLALFIMSAIGWFGAGAIYGGTNAVAGVFSILMVVAAVLIFVAVLIRSPELAIGGAYGLGLAPGLIGLFGGIGLLAGGAKGSAGPLKPIAGIVLLVGGIAMIWVGLVIFGIELPLLSVMGYVAAYGFPIGMALAGVTKILSRTNA